MIKKKLTNRQCLCKAPFSEYKATGPYFSKHSGRHMITLVPLDRTGEKHNRARNYPYARYLMCVHLGRELDNAEHTDHIDGDRTHDIISNLRIVSKSENSRKAATDPLTLLRRSEALYDFKCPHCETWFRRPKKKSHLSHKDRYTTYCTPACAKHASKYRHIKQEYKWVEPEKFIPKLLHEPWEEWSLLLPSRYTMVLRQSRAVVKTCDMCRKPFTGKRRKRAHKYCDEDCAKKAKAREVPSKDRMEKLVTEIASGKASWTSVGRMFGKSDNAVRKWAKKYGLL